MLYFDAGQDRLSDTVAAEFDRAVEAVRVGWIIAQDRKQYQRWRNHRPAKREPGLTGAALEAAVMRIAEIFPANVVRGTA